MEVELGVDLPFLYSESGSFIHTRTGGPYVSRRACAVSGKETFQYYYATAYVYCTEITNININYGIIFLRNVEWTFCADSNVTFRI